MPGVPGVTVIVPVRRVNDYVRESLPRLLAVRRAPPLALDVIVLPDEIAPSDRELEQDGVRLVATGPLGPAAKRDLGASLATGDVLAFLDDDAYPAPDWLERALPHFLDPTVAAVGGPGVTPPSDSFWQQASGWALSTLLGAGGALNRYVPAGPSRDVDDWPSVNLLVRKVDFDAVQGFDCAYYPGEDTKLCLDLTRRLGKRIVYEPRAIVFHHRRALFWGHFRQIGNYATHRGYFVKAFPATSRRPTYFLPTMLTFGLLVGPLLAGWTRLARVAYLAFVGAYGVALAATAVSVSRRSGRLALGPAAALGVCLTHLWYGLLFVRGLLSPRLRS